MSADNPTGWKLEDLLNQIAGEIDTKTARIQHDKSETARFVAANNAYIIDHLKRARDLQLASYTELAKIGKDQGPTGKARIG